MTKNPSSDATLPKGIHRSWKLPDKSLGDLWDSIVMDEAIKKQLLSQAIVNFTVRPKVERTVLPLHGVILLVGPPGTGKTSLARGLAHRVAESFSSAKFRLLEVEPHTLTSSAMGKTQRAVADLFSQSIAESAAAGPTIVLLDEVETLAADRAKLSLEANPVDVHRATDAVLVQLDMLAERNPHLLCKCRRTLRLQVATSSSTKPQVPAKRQCNQGHHDDSEGRATHVDEIQHQHERHDSR